MRVFLAGATGVIGRPLRAVAGSTVCALERGAGVYNIADDEPAPTGEWLPDLAEAIGARPPRRIPKWLAWLGAGSYAVYLMCRQRAITTTKARAELGFIPSIPSWRTGLRERRDR